jgi:hypothetical protein
VRTRGGNRLRILLIVQEYTRWRRARHVSYCSQLGLEEALLADGIECFTLTTPWLGQARRICAGSRFDQVWIDIIQSSLGDEIFADQGLLEWVAARAPVRVGFLPESLDYTSEEESHQPLLGLRRRNVESRIPYLTHVVACDEIDAERIAGRGLAPAIWWPQAVTERSIGGIDPVPSEDPAIFTGAVYGERSRWLDHPDLKGLLVHLPPPEDATLYPICFNTLHKAARAFLRGRLPGASSALSAYLGALRHIRRRSYASWLAGLRQGCAVVNLPHFVKTYAGRVMEGMAAGRPIISWDIPDRPRNRALFEEGREILLFSRESPEQLADQIRRIRRDPVLARRLAENGQAKVRRFHTLERRTREILRWIETGDQPAYGAGSPISGVAT